MTALFRLKNRKAPGMTGIMVDLIRSWFHGANPKEGEGNQTRKHTRNGDGW